MDVEKRVHRELIERKKTLAVAESITGGRLAATLTALPGSSAYFLAGVVAYCNPMKRALLGVPGTVLEERGAVSGETAYAMLQGVLKVTAADYALAVTGVAGPSGGSQERPVGTVWMAVGSQERAPHIEHFLAEGSDREERIFFAVERLLCTLLGYLQATP